MSSAVKQNTLFRLNFEKQESLFKLVILLLAAILCKLWTSIILGRIFKFLVCSLLNTTLLRTSL